ncbi:MAG: hypothetical protein IIB66_05310, partial [Proteobacteria bacterium]|nr:hypothetical protein [Pseudomonadota bacterium]
MTVLSRPVAVPEPQVQRRNLVGLTRDEIAGALAGIGVPKGSLRMRTGQIWHWLYFRGARSFAEMTNVSKAMRTQLEAHFSIGRGDIRALQTSADGTRKWLLGFGPGQEVEAVFIPEEDRGALCVSTQVGCTLNCSFCHTGTQAWVRNLDAAEIVTQLLVARDALGEWPSPAGGRMLSNVVVMGMGEPLYNYENVAGNASNLTVGWKKNADTVRVGIYAQSLLELIAPQDVDATVGTDITKMISIQTTTSVDEVTLFWQVPGSSASNDFIKSRTLSLAGSLGTAGVFLRGVGMAYNGFNGPTGEMFFNVL